MSGVQQVEAAARGDHRAVLGADPGGQGVRVVGVGRGGVPRAVPGGRQGTGAAGGDEGRGGAHRALDRLPHQRPVGEQPGGGGGEAVARAAGVAVVGGGRGTRRGCSP